MADFAPQARQSQRFLLLYALAWAGSAIAYVPFLTILLPVRVSNLAGQGADVSWLAYIAFAGAIAASVGNIGFGYLSDITGNRRGWAWAGLLLSSVLLVATGAATGLGSLIVLVVCWQLSLNMMLAPLAAWAGDTVPDAQKGLLGGLLAFAPGLGALSGAAVTMNGLASADTRLWLVALMVIACVVPLLVAGAPLPVMEAVGAVAKPDAQAAKPQAQAAKPQGRDGVVLRMWLARLAVQIAEAALFAYLFFWFRAIDPAVSDNLTARVFSVVLVLSAPAALLAGRWADTRNRPLVPLVACAAISAAGLVGMSLSRTLPAATIAYALFGLATSVFLALHSTQTLRVLPRSDRRGRDLGVFNLTNTVPSLIMPWFTLALVPYFGFSGLFLLFAALAVVAAVLLAPFARQT
ncbi:MFS transporter [Sandarakinorhabdus sp.]|uniref:MFS transporter n=1 Tax=Sandarakinorhabdus sp. TaxID=1916663 RepID=UPI00286D91C8|nr:MFS transporter [Sandarakinorhabdus sp.]